jgi:hypothetical protein
VGYARVKADNYPHKALQTRKDHADYMLHGRQRPTTKSCWTLLAAAWRADTTFSTFVKPCNVVTGSGVENSSAHLER